MNFWRNGVVSFAAVLIMTVTLFTLGMLLFMGALMESSLEQIRSKVDINIYFTLDAPEDDIFSLKATIETLPEVASVTYISRDDALANFRDRHKNDQLTLQALDELGENPLPASLGIKAKEVSQYEGIATFLEGQSAILQADARIVDKVNYQQNKVAIDRLTKVIDGARKIGFATTLFLILVSVVITFNTIRLAIYTAREEIAVMRLVGAENRYIRGPFIIEGVMYGLCSGIIALILLYPMTLWLGKTTENFFGGLNVLAYYADNFGQIFLIIMSTGIVLGVVSSYLAVRKYLRV